jgi:hypothetical protein
VVPLAKRYGRPAVPFVRKYTPADVALLVEMDKANEDVCGPAIVDLLQRAYQTYGDLRYERLATLSVSLLYNLRKSNGYQVQRKHFTVTRPVCNAIGVRKAPAPQGRAGFVRIDTVHQGDLDGVKGVYHITCIDAVSQWQVQACAQGISEVFLLPVLALIIAQFPFVVQLLEDSEVAITGGFRVAAGDDEGIVAWRYGLMKHRASRQMNVEIKGIGHRFPCQPPVVQPGADS